MHLPGVCDHAVIVALFRRSQACVSQPSLAILACCLWPRGHGHASSGRLRPHWHCCLVPTRSQACTSHPPLPVLHGADGRFYWQWGFLAAISMLTVLASELCCLARSSALHRRGLLHVLLPYVVVPREGAFVPAGGGQRMRRANSWTKLY